MDPFVSDMHFEEFVKIMRLVVIGCDFTNGFQALSLVTVSDIDSGNDLR